MTAEWFKVWVGQTFPSDAEGKVSTIDMSRVGDGLSGKKW